MQSTQAREELRLSIAVPIYNEEEGLPELLRRTTSVLDRIPGGPHELVLVDDGSSDSSRCLLRAAASADPRVVVIGLSRNFGHQAAITAALDHVRGNAVVVMDGDMQDPPEIIPILLDRFEDGFDVVYATRIRRKEPLWLRFCYFTFYRLFAKLASTPIPIDAGDFAVLSRRVVDELRRMPERHRYLRGLRSWAGFRQTGIEVEREHRAAGTSKYSLGRLLKLASDAVFAFSIVPIRAAAAVGGVTVILAILYAIYVLYTRFALSQSPRGFTSLILAVSFFAGVQLLFLGIIGEYVGRVYEEVKGRPQYIVAETVNHVEL